MTTNSLLKNSQPARYGVENTLKMLMYCRVHSAFSGVFALSRTRLRVFQQAANGHIDLTYPRQKGVGLLEVLIALLVFTTGMMGLLSTQLAGKKAGYEATQRSVATALARDILERMQANPGQIAAYVVNNAGDQENPLPMPATNCEQTDCTPLQLAVFDLWQWESLVMGVSEKQGGSNVGGLVSPRACIFREDGAVSVAISWLGATSARDPAESVCGSDIAGLYDAPDEAVGNNLRRRQMIMSTYAGVF
jgi:type IV pilus assembly protein PilV